MTNPFVLVATPYRANTAPGFLKRSQELYDSFTYEPKERVTYPNDISLPGKSKYAPNAQARNELIEKHLGKHHDFVLWVDVDVVEIPSDFIQQLMGISKKVGLDPMDTITAPFVLIEATNRYYDVGSFLQNGRWFSPNPPYCLGGDIVELTSVGTCYMAPSWIYRAGARFSSSNDREIEHVSTMTRAIELGVRIFAKRSLIISHANLPKWHEDFH